MQLEDIKNISVIGTGTMGHGIGLTYALGGYEVALNDTSEAILDNAVSHIRDALKTFVESGLISQDMTEETLSRITTTTWVNPPHIGHCQSERITFIPGPVYCLPTNRKRLPRLFEVD